MIDLREVTIVCTSNIATADLADAQNLSGEALSEFVASELQKELRVELLNRFDGFEIFGALDFDTQLAVFRRHFHDYLDWLAKRGYVLEVEAGVEAFLIQRGFHQRWGARPLRRVIRRYVGNAVVRKLSEGGQVRGRLLLGDGSLEINSMGRAVLDKAG